MLSVVGVQCSTSLSTFTHATGSPGKRQIDSRLESGLLSDCKDYTIDRIYITSQIGFASSDFTKKSHVTR